MSTVIANNKKPIALVILDGFGYRKNVAFNAIAQAKTPHLDNWFIQYPHTLLNASGKDVGLLDNAIGNSEVGHETIGSGRVIEQTITTVHKAIKNGELAHNKILVEKLKQLERTKGRLHLIGLLSDAGIHSHNEILYALIDIALHYNIPHIYIHVIIDGRDVAPKSATRYLKQLDNYIQDKPHVSIGSIHGRYYAMDRDNNLDRTEKSIAILTQKQQPRLSDWESVVNHWYQQDITDEFFPPVSIDTESIISAGDGIIFFNSRPDRARQLTQQLLVQQDHLKFAFLITPVNYDEKLKTTSLFKREKIKNDLMDILHEYHKQVFAIAETEKYAHVTYFFNNGREKPYDNETQTLVPSLKRQTYKSTPEMSARKITQQVIQSLQHDPKDFYLINYANADMVGHSGDMQATIKAVECLDAQLAILFDQIITIMDGTLIITADHGNAEDKFDITNNQPRTSHTTNPVPFLVINNSLKGAKDQLTLTSLADIAPYILKIMQLPIPKEMNHSD